MAWWGPSTGFSTLSLLTGRLRLCHGSRHHGYVSLFWGSLLLFLIACPISRAQVANPQAWKPASEWQERTAEDFVPMTRQERLAHAITSAVGPKAFLSAAVSAGYGQATNRPGEWGQGARGFG